MNASGNKTYKIGEAARLLNLKTHVLRFWETEFSHLKPKRTEKGQRYYTDHDLEQLRQVQTLLHVKGLTIDGAKKELAKEAPPEVPDSTLKEVISELKEIRDLLKA